MTKLSIHIHNLYINVNNSLKVPFFVYVTFRWKGLKRLFRFLGRSFFPLGEQEYVFDVEIQKKCQCQICKLCVPTMNMRHLWKKKDVDLHELFIFKKEDDVIQNKYLSIKSRLKQHCHICSHWMHILSAWAILFFVKTFCIIFIITCNLNQMYYTLPGLHFSYFWERPLEPKNNILCKVKLPYTIYNGLQSCILQVYIFS